MTLVLPTPGLSSKFHIINGRLGMCLVRLTGAFIFALGSNLSDADELAQLAQCTLTLHRHVIMHFCKLSVPGKSQVSLPFKYSSWCHVRV